ncbi:beta-L-arabinofuranosidase domain-containing protein [Wenyingzhuangia sp. IMCC45467]
MRNNITRILFVGLFVLANLCLLAQEKHKLVMEGVSPFSNKSVELESSWIKKREDLNIEYLKNLEPDRLLHNFRVNAGLPSDATPLKGWESPKIGLRGHFVGHYLSAVSILVEKYKESSLTRTLNYMVDELYKCQQAFGNGYLSAFPEKDFDTLEAKFGGVWAPYYTYHKIMQGLLDVYTHTGNQKAYNMVVDMAGYVEQRMSKLNDEVIEKVLYSVGANPANEVGAMNEILYKLYSVSKKTKHLELAKLFDRDWLVNPLSNNEDILSGLHANTHLVLVNGFAQRFMVTKDKKYYNAVMNFWKILMDSHVYVNGSSSGPRPIVVTPTSLSAEHWGNPGVLSNTLTREIAESCVTHNSQKLTSTLFSWTANPIYANAYMNTLYNSVLALQSSYSGKCVYHLPLGSPRKKIFLNDDDFRCCNGTSIEAFSSLNNGIYYHNESSIFVNLFIPSKVNWNEKKVTLTQKGSFLADKAVDFIITTKSNSTFDVNLLVPSWSKKVEVFINNEKQNIHVKPNSYICLNREWKNNDKIKMVFDFDFYIESMPDNEKVIAIFYGPSLLAFETSSEIILKGGQDEILKSIYKDQESNIFYLENGGNKFQLRPLYDIEEQSYGVYGTIRNF